MQYALPHMQRTPRWPVLLAIALAAVLMLPFLDTIPGLHGDEAWVGLRVHALSQGHHTVYGMNAYTGSVHQYLLLPLMQLLGYRVWVLRGFTVATSLFAIALYAAVARRLFGARTGLLAALLLATMPFFTLYGRTATENFALNPLCALAAILLLLRAGEARGRARALQAFGAGLLLALATWSHIIFLPIPAMLLLIALTRARLGLLRSPLFWGAALGFCCGLAPRIVAQVVAPPAQSALAVSVQRDKLVHLLPVRLREWPGILGGIVHGDLLYQRYAGEVRWRTPPIAPLLGLLALGWLAYRAAGRRHADRRSAREVLLALAACFALTILLSPESADRYQLMIAWFAPLALALLLEALGGSGARRCLPPIAVALLVAFNVVRTAVNFHAAQLGTGGRTSAFRLGLEPQVYDAETPIDPSTRATLLDQHLVETSNHFVRTDRLYEELVQRGLQGVFTEFMIAMPLLFYDLDRRFFSPGAVLYPDLFLGQEPSAELIPDRDRRVVISYSGGLRWLVPPKWGATRPLFRFEAFELHGFAR